MKLTDLKILAGDVRKVVDRNKSCYINIPRRFARLLKVKPGDKIMWMLEPNGKTIRIKKCSFNESVLGDDPAQLMAYLNGVEDYIGHTLDVSSLGIILLEGDPNLETDTILEMELPNVFTEEQEDVES